MAGYGPEDDGEHGDEDRGEERHPERAPEEELADVGLSDADRAERSLRKRIRSWSRGGAGRGVLTVSDRPMKTIIGSRSYECATMLRIANVNGRMICSDERQSGCAGGRAGEDRATHPQPLDFRFRVEEDEREGGGEADPMAEEAEPEP